MMFIVLVTAFLVIVHGQIADPTKVCLPDVLQINIASLYRNLSGILVYNFPEQVAAYRYSDGTRQVFDLTDFSIAVINDTDESCQKYTSPNIINGLVSQCMPADAQLLTNSNTYLGANPGGLEIEGWEYTVHNVSIVKIAVTKRSPAVPVFRQIISTDPPTPHDIQIFVNGKTTIDDPTIYALPVVCPFASIVD